MKYFDFDIQLFADYYEAMKADGQTGVNLNVETTDSAGLSAEMKTFYSKDLIELAKANLVHAQFAEHKSLPKNGGKIIEWRKWSNFKKALKPLEEGVTPDGKTLTVDTIAKKVEQFGAYSSVSDVLSLTAIDNVIVEYTAKHADNAALTLDTIARNELLNGTQVIYGGSASTRSALTAADKLTPDLVAKAVTQLKKNNAPRFGSDYVAIIHPSVAYDLMRNQEWINTNAYSGHQDPYAGEIGKLYGVRFVESTEARVLKGNLPVNDSNFLNVTASDGDSKTVTCKEVLTSGTGSECAELAGKTLLLYNGTQYEEVTVSSAAVSGSGDSARTVITTTEKFDITDVTRVYPGGGGGIDPLSGTVAVYPCIFLGKGAFGDVDLEGGGMETIVKALGSGGTADPLNQRSTIGWKCTGYGAQILIPEYIVRVEVGSTFSGTDEAN